jgi:hypothetical protein
LLVLILGQVGVSQLILEAQSALRFCKQAVTKLE